MPSQIVVLIAYFFVITSSVVMAAVPFQSIEKGHSSGIKEAMNDVYKSNQQFGEFWNRHTSHISPTPEVPAIDFANQMVVVVITQQSSGGYSLEITSAEEDENKEQLVVNYLTTPPPPGTITTQALTQPYHIISLEKSDKNVIFLGSDSNDDMAERMPVFIVRLQKGVDKQTIREQILALPGIKNVEGMKSMPTGFIYFDSDRISYKKARASLDRISEIISIDEE